MCIDDSYLPGDLELLSLVIQDARERGLPQEIINATLDRFSSYDGRSRLDAFSTKTKNSALMNRLASAKQRWENPLDT